MDVGNGACAFDVIRTPDAAWVKFADFAGGLGLGTTSTYLLMGAQIAPRSATVGGYFCRDAPIGLLN